MNWSLYTADRFTHVKILVVGLSIVVLISVMGIVAAEINRDVGVMTERAPAVIKAGAPTVFATMTARRQIERAYFNENRRR